MNKTGNNEKGNNFFFKNHHKIDRKLSCGGMFGSGSGFYQIRICYKNSWIRILIGRIRSIPDRIPNPGDDLYKKKCILVNLL